MSCSANWLQELVIHISLVIKPFTFTSSGPNINHS